MAKLDGLMVSGAALPFQHFHGSLGDFLIQKMRSRAPGDIVQINAETGEGTSVLELLKLSIQISEGLIGLGLNVGDIVALAGRNSTQLHASALGVLWAGGVFAAVEPTMKVFEMELLYKQLEPKFVLCEPDIEQTVLECLRVLNNDGTIVIIDSLPNQVSSEKRLEDILQATDVDAYKPRQIANPASDLAIITCSSGSTGIPKGVGLTHQNLVYQLSIWDHVPNFDPTWSGLQSSHFFWISGILVSLLSYIFPSRRIYLRTINTVSILEAIHKYKPYWGMLPPAELLAMLNHPDFKKYNVSSFKHILTGGSPLPKAIADRVKSEWCPDVKIAQAFGMTEMSGCVCDADPAGDIMSVGTPTFEVKLKVSDITTENLLGPNQVGEIRFKSPGVFKCYVGNETATKEAFDEEGWFRTGDLGYYNEKGCLYLVDRLKEVIKFRNFQISPSEVEAFIASLTGVKEVGVIGIPNEKDSYHPMAIVVKLENADITAADIIQNVKDNLSEYKQLRAGVQFVEALPRTATGKLKRKELRELGLTLHRAVLAQK